VDDLVIDSKLTAVVVDDEHAYTATTIVESVLETLAQVALIDDWKALLDVTRLGHGNDTAIIADVEDTVLLEDRAEHVLDNDRRRWVGDEAGLLVELLREEVNPKVAVLTGLGGCGDADDLARTTLEDEKVSDADVVAGDGNGVGRHGAGSVGDRLVSRLWCRGRDLNFSLLDDYFFTVFVTFVVMVAASVNGVENSVSSAVQTVTE